MTTQALAIADNEVAGIQMAAKAEAPIELVIDHMGRKVNSRYTEFAPVMHPEGQLYLAALPSSELVVLDGTAEEKHAKIYESGAGQKG